MHRLAAGVLLVALAGGGPSPEGQTVSASNARQALMAAENNRIDLPDALQTPTIDLLRKRLSDDLRIVTMLSNFKDGDIKRLAIRTLGRYRRRELIPEILQHLTEESRGEVALALAESLRGAPLPNDPGGNQLRLVQDALIASGDRDPYGRGIGQIVRSVARLPYTNAGQVQAADAFLARLMGRLAEPNQRMRPAATDLASAAETIARVHPRTAPLGSENIDWLLRMVKGGANYDPVTRSTAMQALIAAGRLDEEALRLAAISVGAQNFMLRRLAAVSLGGASSPVAHSERTTLLTTLLEDQHPAVRIDAVRAWVRHETAQHGCDRIVARVGDREIAVAVVAIDALADACPEDATIAERLAVLSRAPSATNANRQSRALVSLAKRAPERVAIVLAAHLRHSDWLVRLYAARAAAIVSNQPVLERLALDPDDNVREATLAALRRLKGNESEPHFLAALERRDYQLLRTAAMEMKGMPRTPALAGALADALKRVTAEGRETSRDTRMALIERLAELGDENQAAAVAPLLRDFDIPVAIAAAQLLSQWSGRPEDPDPQPLPRPAVPSDAEVAEAAAVRIEVVLASPGEPFEIRLLPDQAPMTSVRFLQLVNRGYYNGLTIHRVVPNFVVQGGSPGANEYSGDGAYAHDEIGSLSHREGTIGLSTRGHDTGDLQFFVNLVHNPRLDYDYTVFAAVTAGDYSGMFEAAEIREIRVKKEDDKRDRPED